MTPPDPDQAVHLILRGRNGPRDRSWTSPSTFRWNGARYVSIESGLPLSITLEVVGWFCGNTEGSTCTTTSDVEPDPRS